MKLLAETGPMTRAERIKEKLLAAGVAPQDIRGLAPEAIRQLEHDHRVNFPDVYRDFLATIGDSRNVGLSDFYMFAPDIPKIVEAAHDYLADTGVQLPAGVFPIAARVYGFPLYIFLPQNGDGPPAYVMNDLTDGGWERCDFTIATLIEDLIDQWIYEKQSDRRERDDHLASGEDRS